MVSVWSFAWHCSLSAFQDRADAIERVALAATVPVDLLLHPVADLIDSLGAEHDHMERVERAAVASSSWSSMAFFVAVERIQRGDLDTAAEPRLM